ncbi:MAG: hypothetical protein ACOZCL_16235 [Bacillota bacterium]
MSTQIYQNTNFKVYRANHGFIVHNSDKNFSEGHTHVQKYDTCMVMIKLLKSKKPPKSKSRYFLESLLRLSDDDKYNNQLKQMLMSV